MHQPHVVGGIHHQPQSSRCDKHPCDGKWTALLHVSRAWPLHTVLRGNFVNCCQVFQVFWEDLTERQGFMVWGSTPTVNQLQIIDHLIDKVTRISQVWQIEYTLMMINANDYRVINFLYVNGKFCRLSLSETSLTWDILPLHRHILPFWNQDDPRIEILLFSFGLEAQLALHSIASASQSIASWKGCRPFNSEQGGGSTSAGKQSIASNVGCTHREIPGEEVAL